MKHRWNWYKCRCCSESICCSFAASRVSFPTFIVRFDFDFPIVSHTKTKVNTRQHWPTNPPAHRAMRRAEFYLYLLPKVDHRGLRARICSNLSKGTGGKSQIDSHCRHVDIMSTSCRYHWSTRMSCWSSKMTCWSRRMCSWPRRMSCRPRRSCRPTTRDHRDDLRLSNNDSIWSESTFRPSGTRFYQWKCMKIIKIIKIIKK